MEYVEKSSQLADYEISFLLKSGYKKVFDSDLQETYFYDPECWKLINKSGQEYDYIYDNLCLKSLTNESYILAMDEGFFESETFK